RRDRLPRRSPRRRPRGPRRPAVDGADRLTGTGPLHLQTGRVRARRPAAAAAIALTALLAGCSSTAGGAPSASPTPSASASGPRRVVAASPTPTPSAPTSVSPAPVPATAVVAKITDAQWSRMVAAGVWRPGCPVGQSGLRRVEVPYVGFDGRTHR